MTEVTSERLGGALRLCAFKLKVEYDRQQPDAPAGECWAAAEAAWALLRELEEARPA